MDLELGTMDSENAELFGQRLGEGTLHRGYRSHRLCAGCNEKGSGRLRLSSRFPLVPLFGTGAALIWKIREEYR